MKYEVRPVSLRVANDVVRRWHSHLSVVRGHLFSLGAFEGDVLVGVVVVGRPVARALDDGRTYEVTRLCTNGAGGAASQLLSRARRVVQAMGVRSLVSYTRADEAATSYRAAGWRVAAASSAHRRPRSRAWAQCDVAKVRWTA